MKIEMSYGQQVKGTAQAEGDTITYGGAHPIYVQEIVEFYGKQTKKQGDDLLRYVMGRLQGRTWVRSV
jgi:hypothetical protein